MRLLLWYWGRRGGGAQFALALGGALARRPDAALHLSVSAQGHLLDGFRALGAAGLDAVPTYGSPLGFALRTPLAPLLARRLVAQARAAGAEAVVSAMTHTWTPLVAPVLQRAGLAFVPVVHDARPHPGDSGLLWDWRLGRELAAARAAVALSGAVAGALARRRPDLPLIRLPLGALLAPGGPAPPPADGAPFAFVFFGRLRAYKGLDLLRDAFRLLRARRPRATLLVAGEGDAEALAPGLSALPGATVAARWVGEAEIGTLLAGAHAVVLPYREASQSAIAPMAHAAGVPVVATPVGGLSEQVADGTDGLLAAAATAEALALAMERVMDPVLHARLAAGAAAAGRRLADWDAHAATLLAGLRALPPVPPPPGPAR